MRIQTVLVLLLLLAPGGLAQEGPAPIETLIERGRAQLGEMRSEFDQLFATSMRLFASNDSFREEERERKAAELRSWVGVFPDAFAETFRKEKRLRAIRRLAEVIAGSHDQKAGETMLALLPELSGEKRLLLIQILGRLETKAALKPLQGLVKKGPVAERGAALVALARLGAEGADQLTTEALMDESPEMRLSGIEALPLAISDARSAVRHLTARIDGDDVPSVRYAAIRALAGYPEEGRAQRALKDAVSGSDEAARNAALDAYEKALDKSARSGLREAVKATEVAETRRRIAKLLLRLGDSSGAKFLLKGVHDRALRRPRDLAAQRTAANSYRDIGAYAEALEFYQRVLNALGRQGDPNSTYLSIARCYARLGKFADARKFLKRAGYGKDLSVFSHDADFAEMAKHRKYRSLFEKKSSR